MKQLIFPHVLIFFPKIPKGSMWTPTTLSVPPQRTFPWPRGHCTSRYGFCMTTFRYKFRYLFSSRCGRGPQPKSGPTGRRSCVLQEVSLFFQQINFSFIFEPLQEDAITGHGFTFASGRAASRRLAKALQV